MSNRGRLFRRCVDTHLQVEGLQPIFVLADGQNSKFPRQTVSVYAVGCERVSVWFERESSDLEDAV